MASWALVRCLIQSGLMIAVLVPVACAHAACPTMEAMPTANAFDAALRERIRHEPESEVGVLIQTIRTADEADRRALARAGVEVGTVAGSIVTGRLRACDALRVAELSFVTRLELARELPRPDPPPLIPRPSSS